MKQSLLLACLLTCLAVPMGRAEEYPLGPDSQRQAGVPQGTVTKYTWTSKLFPGAVRDYWVYVPAQYTPAKPTCVMVFQDGHSYVSEDGRARIPIVFDNLIAKHDMPVTIAILIDPGIFKAASPGQQDRSNRSYEYDGLSDRYAQFLLNEILPEVTKHFNLSTNPNDRAISGGSSGGICSFTVAWTHPEAFRRVLSFIGSYTDLRGGDIYPALIRKTEPKPLRVFLQDGNHDLNNFAGDWWLANQSMASALTFAGYDVKFVTGDKNHDMIQGGAIMPDALRWLWRGYPQPIAKPAMKALGDPKTGFAGVDSDWELVSVAGRVPNQNTLELLAGATPPKLRDTIGMTVNQQGDVFTSDTSGKAIYRIGADRQVSTLVGDANGARGLAMGSDGLLHACDGTGISSYASDGRRTSQLLGVNCKDLAVDRKGGLYFSEYPFGVVSYLSHGDSKVWNRSGAPRLNSQDGSKPKGICLSPDQSVIYVSDPWAKWIWSYNVQADGALTDGEPFLRMETRDESSASGASGLAMDSQGLLYIATLSGIQICDQQGRVVAILNRPENSQPWIGPIAGLALGGPEHQYLYVAVGNDVFRRHLVRRSD